MAAKTLLDLAAENPKGWGEAPAAPDLANVGSVVYRDEQGNPYDANGRRIYEMHAPQPQPSLGESLLNIAESPAKMLVGAVTEPISALQRLAENSVDDQGNIAIPNPENPQNQQDVLTGLLSLYGGNALNPAAAIPKGGLAAGALREAAESAPQRMYHGTTADFSTFKPSESGSFGPGVYFSSSPEYASQFAFEQNGSRVFPVDVQGPLASMEDYFSLLHANGRNQAKTLKMLEDQGYTGIITSGERPSQNVTSVFKPGSVRSATTGETLFSDTGKPSIAGAAVAGAEAPPVQAFHATNASFDKFDPAFTNEVGFHFGDKGTANNRAYIRANGNPISYMKYRNIPVEMDIQNPAAISRDVTPNYSGLPLARQLVKDGIAPPSLIDDISGKPQAEQNAAVRDWLVSNGYDAVKYPNKFEGGGKPSYMALGTGNVKHAKTGQVLYSGAPPVVPSASDDDQPLSLAHLALIAGR